MKHIQVTIAVTAFILISSCKMGTNNQASDEEIWKLGWRMMENFMDENLDMANLQFDSLLNISQDVDKKFLSRGLEIKSKLNRNGDVTEIISNQDEETIRMLCKKGFLSTFKSCEGLSDEKVLNDSLKMELIKMYVDDQAARGNLMNDIIDKYALDLSMVTTDGMQVVDERNRNRLKEIFASSGFPNKKEVGTVAMQGIFLIIQHSDADKEWQMSQLSNIEAAVKKGDMDGQSYAYLYDRIKINSGEKQLYGTQFSNVDRVNRTVKLADTEDIENLDERRRYVGMMPIAMYKRVMLKNI